MNTVRIPTEEALLRYLVARRTEVDEVDEIGGHEVPLYPGGLAIDETASTGQRRDV